jgi:transcriptional regulator with XRE-family HTH domain
MTQPIDPTERFKEWMQERRLKAADVCSALHVSEQAIHNWRSAGIPPRRWVHVERYMEEWTDPTPRSVTATREISDEDLEAFRTSDALVLRPTEGQFDQWDRASRKANAGSLKEWIITGLDELAEREIGPKNGSA